MLLTQKAYIEGVTALLIYCAREADLAGTAKSEEEELLRLLLRAARHDAISSSTFLRKSAMFSSVLVVLARLCSFPNQHK